MPKYFEFEAALAGVRPRIRRRFLLRQQATFIQLHEAIQDAAQWWNYHLFLFRSPEKKGGRPVAGLPSDEDVDLYDEKLPDAHTTRVSSYFGKERKTCLYEYDFGDGWLCEVKLIREVSLPETFRRRLLGGERAFPHEDCGGYGGYERCLEVVKTGKDSDDEEAKELLEWLGGWEPEKFEFEKVKRYFDKNKHVPVPGED